jgi:hypothetical protein
MAWRLLFKTTEIRGPGSDVLQCVGRKEVTVFWAILIAAVEVIGIYLVLTVISSLWQQRISVRFPTDDAASTSRSA